jgi:hypothetical protein
MDCSHQDIYIIYIYYIYGLTVVQSIVKYIYIYINPDKMGEEMMSRHML